MRSLMASLQRPEVAQSTWPGGPMVQDSPRRMALWTALHSIQLRWHRRQVETSQPPSKRFASARQAVPSVPGTHRCDVSPNRMELRGPRLQMTAHLQLLVKVEDPLTVSLPARSILASRSPGYIRKSARGALVQASPPRDSSREIPHVKSATEPIQWHSSKLDFTQIHETINGEAF